MPEPIQSPITSPITSPINNEGPLSESPLFGSSKVGPGITGAADAHPGVLGVSNGSAATSADTVILGPSDGVRGEGFNGVHGLTTFSNGCGVLGENSSSGFGVSGISAAGTGVYGAHGASSATVPAQGCGILGESTEGYGVYGSAGTGGVFGVTTAPTFALQNAGVTGESNGPGPAVVAHNRSSGVGAGSALVAIAGGNDISALALANLPGLAAFFAGDVYVVGSFTMPNAAFSHDVSVAGGITVAGDIVLTGADCAEHFDLKDFEAAEPGSVMVIDDKGSLRPSTTAYDRRVAGVVSGAGSLKPGVVLDSRKDGGAVIALVGKVFCKVDASTGPIAVGDLLTSSDTPGHAMRVADPLIGFGSVIGKALQSMESGRGLIPILVALQ